MGSHHCLLFLIFVGVVGAQIQVNINTTIMSQNFSFNNSTIINILPDKEQNGTIEQLFGSHSYGRGLLTRLKDEFKAHDETNVQPIDNHIHDWKSPHDHRNGANPAVKDHAQNDRMNSPMGTDQQPKSAQAAIANEQAPVILRKQGVRPMITDSVNKNQVSLKHVNDNSIRLNVLSDQEKRNSQIGQLIDACFHDLYAKIGDEYPFKSVIESLYSELVSSDENSWIDKNFRNTTALMIGMNFAQLLGHKNGGHIECLLTSQQAASVNYYRSIVSKINSLMLADDLGSRAMSSWRSHYANSKRSRRSVNDHGDDAALIDVFSKSTKGMMAQIMESGIQISMMPLINEETVPRGNDSRASSFFLINMQERISSISELLIYPSPKWEYPILMRNLKENSQANSVVFSNERFFSLTDSFPECKTLPRINRLHHKCQVGMAMIRVEDGRLCRIVTSCPTGQFIRADYTCEDQQVQCKQERLYLNGEFEGYRNDSLSAETMKKIITKPLQEVADVELLGSMGICSISTDVKIRDCVNSMQTYGPIVYSFLDNGGLIISPHITPRLNLYFSSEDPNFYQCNFAECLKEEHYSDCTGDHEYCKRLNKKCNIASNKRCIISKGSVGYKTIDGKKLIASIVLWQFYTVDMDQQLFLNLEEEIIGQRSGHDHMARLGSEVALDCHGSKLGFVSALNVNKMILQVGQMYHMITFNDTNQTTIGLPFSSNHEGEILKVSFFDNKGLVEGPILTPCEFYDKCFDITCGLCWERIINPLCLTNEQRIILMVVSLFSIFLIGFLISLFLKRINGSRSEGLLRRMAASPARQVAGLYGNLRRTFAQTSSFRTSRNDKISNDRGSHLNGSSEPLMSEEPSMSSIKVEPRQNTRVLPSGERVVHHLAFKRKSQKIFCLLVLLVVWDPIKAIRGCSTSSTLVINQKECSEVNGLTKCIISSEAVFAGAGEGQETCISLQTDDNHNVGFVNLKVVSLSFKCQKSSLYYTFASKLFSNHVANCAGQENCWFKKPDVDPCDEWLANDEMMLKEYPDNINKLSKKYCSRPPGCAGNGCADCRNGCSFGVTTVENPTQEVIEVYECSSWTPQVKVRVMVNGDEDIQEREFTLASTYPVQEEKYKLTLRGFSVPPRDVGFCLMKIKDLIVASSCQKASQLSLGGVGEVRCPSYDDAKIASSKCIMAPEYVQYNAVNWGWFVRNNQVNISTIMSKNSLPIQEGNSLIMNDFNGDVLMKMTGGAIAEISILFKSLELVKKTEKADCFSTDLNISGCYSCSTGANLTGSFWTKKGSTFALLTCGSVFSFPLMVNETKMNFNKIVFSDTQDMTMTCALHCSGNIIEINLKGSLKRSIMMDIATNEYSISTPGNEESSFSGFFFKNIKFFVPAVSLGTLLLIMSIAALAYKCFDRTRSGALTILPMVIDKKINTVKAQ